jgi:hypothetical protein
MSFFECHNFPKIIIPASLLALNGLSYTLTYNLSMIYLWICETFTSSAYCLFCLNSEFYKAETKYLASVLKLHSRQTLIDVHNDLQIRSALLLLVQGRELGITQDKGYCCAGEGVGHE